MASIFNRNERIKEQILKPENCHCSYRTLTGANTASAWCTEDKTLKAELVWHHTKSKTRITLKVPFGAKFSKIVPIDCSLDFIDSTILSLFVLMDTAWDET